jgi:hypothetical protein
MNPVKEKVKDIVEVRNYANLKDFDSDPKETIACYHFTDITSEMMGRWLDRISVVHSRGGAAFALAGYRGVGKSHFLAVLGAVVSHTELRSAVADPYISAGAQRLLRRHYPVVHVKRGTAETLLDEMAIAVRKAFPEANVESDKSIEAMIGIISRSTGDMPAVILIDTAFERGVRVSRDDGKVLGGIADLAKEQNIFVGVALDDDIAGADGVNADIARAYEIDYLDQEHLYTVVNRHVFPKHPEKQAVLRDVYQYFRNVLPNFRWSEQKFTSLYPLHPSILDVAPFVRLHVHDFALLSFASEAGEKILGRPAMSLIALDEVFDKVETGLRGIKDLQEPFAAYDNLNTEVVAKIPVMQRLQAKLILKALMLLSLDGQGASAAEIAQSMLIFDESDPAKAIKSIEEIISLFAAAMPQDVQQTSAEGRESKYGFRMTSKDQLNLALDNAAAQCPPEVVTETLIRLFQERFPETTLQGSKTADGRTWIEVNLNWRGSVRHGRLSFVRDAQGIADAAVSAGLLDWEVLIELSQDETMSESPAPGYVLWRPDPLTLSETDTLRRYYVLTTDNEIKNEFADQIQAPIHSHGVAAARILRRSFLEDGKLVIDGFDYNFSEDARDTQSLTDVFSIMLETLFETRFPEHPQFRDVLGASDVSSLISGLYGDRESVGIENLVRNFAEPLGFARSTEEGFELEPFDRLVQLPYFSSVMALAEDAGFETVPLEKINLELTKAPYGLVRESQRLVLTALVAERKLDFVTEKGDKINHRSLDLRIIWDDIVGIAKSANSELSKERLLEWAAVLIDGDAPKSITDKKDVARMREAFEKWIQSWRKSRVLERFDKLPDDVFNTRIWRTSSNIGKVYNSLAETITLLLDNSIELEECLLRIASIYTDSIEDFERKRSELLVLEDFVRGAELRERVLTFSLVSQFTNDDAIETQRARLIEAAELCSLDPGDGRNRELGYLLEKYQKDHAANFIGQHDAVMRSHRLQERYVSLKASPAWVEFRTLTGSGLIDPEDLGKVRAIADRLDQLDCSSATENTVSNLGSCICAFRIDTADEWDGLPEQLLKALEKSVANFRTGLIKEREIVVGKLSELTKTADADHVRIASGLKAKLKAGGELPSLGFFEVNVLAEAMNTKPRLPNNDTARPKTPVVTDEIAVLADENVLVEI